MKKFILIWAVVLMMLIPLTGMGDTTYGGRSTGRFKVVTGTWTSNGSGVATVTFAAADVAGWTLKQVKCIPGAGVSASYGLTLTDAAGGDVVGGAGAGRTNATTGDYFYPFVDKSYGPVDLYSGLTGNVSAAGASVSGTIMLFLE